MNSLELFRTENVDDLAWPPSNTAANLKTPALHFLIDYKSVRPLVIESSCPAVEAAHLMKRAHVDMKIVVDRSNHFMGIISRDDINNQSILSRLDKATFREELTVADLMTVKDQLFSFDFEKLISATIGDVLTVMRENHLEYCLVVDHDVHEIRGLFSSGSISQALGVPADIELAQPVWKIMSA